MACVSRPRETLLVEPEWLAARLDEPFLRVVDIRGTIRPPEAPKPHYAAAHEAYARAHLPGAVFVDWLCDIVDPDAAVPLAVAPPERIAALMGRLGIGDAHTVVVYDDHGSLAARLWWVLRYYGHPDVRLLNGGWSRWVAEGRPVTAAVPRHPPATFTPRAQPGWRAAADEVRRRLGAPGLVLVDCRSPAEFRGEVTRGQRPGRIPGAVNVPAARLLEGPYRTWRSEAELARLFEAAGVTHDAQVITYCNAGVAAAAGLFALRLLGHPAARNFAGSWYEWERDPENPVAAG